MSHPSVSCCFHPHPSPRPPNPSLMACVLQVYDALRQRLEGIITTRNKLAGALVQIKASQATPAAKQRYIDKEVDAFALQLRSAVHVRRGGGGALSLA